MAGEYLNPIECGLKEQKKYINVEQIQFHYLPISAIGDVYALKNEIDKIPAANIEEVRHGEWLCINGTIFCSECQGKALYEYNENDNDDFPFLLPMRSKRCPHCGAIMTEGKNE